MTKMLVKFQQLFMYFPVRESSKFNLHAPVIMFVNSI